MTGVERWKVAITTNQRGPVLTRPAATREEAFRLAHVLLDQAEDMTAFHGEVLSVAIAQAIG